MPTITGFAPPPIVPKPGLTGVVERLLPGGESGFMVAKRRRMNVTNVRALRRAGRRVRGFLKLASRLGALPVSRGKSRKLFKRKTR
jgi:phage terminase small subunit